MAAIVSSAHTEYNSSLLTDNINSENPIKNSSSKNLSSNHNRYALQIDCSNPIFSKNFL